MVKHWVYLLAVLLGPGQVQADETRAPRELVDSTIEALRASVIRDQALMESDPDYAMTLVETTVAPHVDMRLASRLVLGKYWREATTAQRDAFVDGLRRLLMRIFAIHIRDYSDAEITYSPTIFKGEDNRRAVVRTHVSRSGAPEVSVDYRLYNATDGWKVYDVSIVGISLIKTYHLTLQRDLKRHGIDDVIDQINAKSPLHRAGPDASPQIPPAG